MVTAVEDIASHSLKGDQNFAEVVEDLKYKTNAKQQVQALLSETMKSADKAKLNQIEKLEEIQEYKQRKHIGESARHNNLEKNLV